MEQIDVRILDREYRLAVSPDQRERLLEAVSMVDGRMRALRDSGRVAGIDRIAVMAALQLANELLAAPAAGAGTTTTTGDIIRRIRSIKEEIDAEIERQERLF
jgi:cell division protein ZapA